MINLQDPHLEKFFNHPFFYTGISVRLRSPQFRGLMKSDDIQLYWRHKQFDKKIIIQGNNNSYSISLKQQSESQEQLQYEGRLVSKIEGYSMQAALKYTKNSTTFITHTITPSFQVNFFGQGQPNLDFGIKYNYLDLLENINIRGQIEFLPQIGFQNYCLVGNFRKQQRIQIGIKNQNAWLGSIVNLNQYDIYSLLNYDLKSKQVYLSSYFSINGKQKIFERLKLVFGVSTKKEILAQTRFLTREFELGYCVKWQHGSKITTGFHIEI